MKRIIMTTLFASWLLTGCAATQSPSQLTQLMIKVNQMDRKLDERGREIEELKYKLNNLSTQVDDNNNVSLNGPVEDINTPDTATAKDTETTHQSADLSPFKKKGGIIRVSQSPQQVQTALKTAGYYKGNIDGKIGGSSQQAIRDFQKDHNLKVDGIVGKATWAELQNYLK